MNGTLTRSAVAVAIGLLAWVVWIRDTRAAGPSALSEAERRVATEVLLALKALESVTTAGVAYQEYARRVLDSKIVVDRYLQAIGGDPAIKTNIRDAMALYVFAAAAWNAHITGRYADVADDPRMDLCWRTKIAKEEAIKEDARQGRNFTHVSAGITAWVAVQQGLIWSCATDKIADADYVMKGGKGRTEGQVLRDGTECEYIARGRKIDNVGSPAVDAAFERCLAARGYEKKFIDKVMRDEHK